MAMNRFKFGVGFVLDATDRATKTFRKIGSGFRTMARGIMTQARKLKNSMTTLAIGAPLMLAGQQAVGGLAAISDAAGKFEMGLAAVGAITKATVKDLGLLEEAAIQAGIKTQFSPQESIEGLERLASASLTVKQSIDTLIPSLDLAAGARGQLGVAEASEAVVGVMKSFRMEAKQATYITDRLLRATQLSNFQTRDFAVGLSKAAASGAVFDQSLDEVLISMGLLRTMGIDASSAATAFRESTRRLAADQGSQQKLMKQGIKIYDDQDEKMLSILEIINNLVTQTPKLTGRQRKMIAAQTLGARGLLMYNAVMQMTFTTQKNGVDVTYEGIEALHEQRKAMEKSGGTAEEFRKKLLATFEGQKVLLKGTLETLGVVFGKPLAAMLKPIVGAFTNMLNALIRAWKQVPEPVKKAVMAFVSVGAIITAVVGGVLLFKAALGLLGISFGSIITTIGQVLIGMPLIGIVLGGISVAIYSAYKAFKKNTGGIATSWKDLTTKLRLGFEGVIAIVKGQKFSKELTEELQRAENQGVLRFLNRVMIFKDRIVAFWDGLKKGFDRGVAALAESSAMKRLMRTFNAVFGVFTDPEAKNTPGILRRWGHSGEEAGTKLAKLGEIALNALNAVVDLGKMFASAMEGITAKDIQSAIMGVVGVFKAFHSVLKGIWTVLGWLKKAFMIIYRVVRMVGAAIGEFTGAIVSNLDFVRGARAKRVIPFYEHFLETAKEARGLAGEFGEPGIVGEAPRAIVRRQTVETRTIETARLRAVRGGAQALLERRRREGGDTAQMLITLRYIDEKLALLNKQQKKGQKIVLDAEELNATLGTAAEGEAARATDEVPVAMTF
jgi:TP901 family phage tail tape measure protein